MAKRAILLIAVVSCFSATLVPCWANLGDNLDQAIARYGKPVAQGKGDSTNAGYPWYAFKYGKFEIEETFSEDKGSCWMEIWWKEDRTPMTESDHLAVLNANIGTEKWGEAIVRDEGVISWIRKDGATAMYSPIRGSMTVGNEMLLMLIPARKH